jgi:hypothetical protein
MTIVIRVITPNKAHHKYNAACDSLRGVANVDQMPQRNLVADRRRIVSSRSSTMKQNVQIVQEDAQALSIAWNPVLNPAEIHES